LIEIGLSGLYGFSVRPDFDIMQQSHGLFVIAKLLVIARHAYTRSVRYVGPLSSDATRDTQKATDCNNSALL